MNAIIEMSGEYILNINISGVFIIKKSRLFLTAGGIIAVILLIFLKSRQAAAGAFDGLILAAQVLIPSLFVFMCICEFVVKSGVAEALGRILAPVTRFLFGLPGELSAGIILSFIGGYPAGAKCAYSLYKQGRVSFRDARGMIYFAVNCGPAFIIFGIGDIMYQSRLAGVLLFASTGLASIITGVILGIPGRIKPKLYVEKEKISLKNPPGGAGSPEGLAEIFVESVSSACSTMLLICAFVVLFSSLTSAVMDFPLPDFANKYLPGILEVTSGITGAVRSGSPAVCAALISFAGISVHFQIMAVSRELFPPFYKFVFFRIISAVIAGVIMHLFSFISPEIRSVFSNGTSRAFSLPAVSVPAAAALLFMIVVFLVDFTQRENEKSEVI